MDYKVKRKAKEKQMTRKDIEDKIANVVDEFKKLGTIATMRS